LNGRVRKIKTMNLFEYCLRAWDRSPHPAIDHALRIFRNEDGTFHFYVHPSNVSGDTADFIVSEDGSVAPRA
jgi:hypothetical protein